MNTFLAIFFYLSTLVFVVGLLYRIRDYANTPAPLKIPTTPAPTTTGGVVLRMSRELFFFESLFKGNLWIWAMGWLFHFSMLVVVMRHLRYFTDPVWGWVAFIQPFGIYAGITMLLGLIGLLGRRILVERIKYISTPSDYLMLILLIAIAASGLLMKFALNPDVIEVKRFFLGLMHLQILDLPDNFILYGHLSLVSLLLLIFPISKLLHAPGVFFSPTRNQTDNPREVRHIAAWAAKLESEK
jgi:nitrate reductase gamma subunit